MAVAVFQAIICAAIMLPVDFAIAGPSTNKAAATVKLRALPAVKTRSGGYRGIIPLGYIGASDRYGNYYLPRTYRSQALPVMVILHGSGMNGLMMVNYFNWLADKFNFIIVAPDSMNKLVWAQRSARQSFSTDWEHVQASYRYVTTLPGVRVNRRKILYAGFSRGGYSAAALASRTPYVTHALVAHSAVTPSQIGWHKVPIRFSTGNRDPMFTSKRVQNAMAMMRKLKPGFPMSLKVYGGGHSLGNAAELQDDVRWWLA